MLDQPLEILICSILYIALIMIFAVLGTSNRIKGAKRIVREYRNGLFQKLSTPCTARKIRWLIIVEVFSVIGLIILMSLFLLGDLKQTSIIMTIFCYFLILVGLTTSFVLYREVIKKLKD